MATESHAAASESHAPAAAGHAAHGAVPYLHHHFDDIEQQRECTSLAMWAFLCTEAMMFGGLFFAYSLYRYLYPGAYHLGSHHLDITLGTINTFVLLFSSLTMALAVHNATVYNRNRLVGFLICTWILGAAFLGIKAVEWTKDYHEGLMPAVRWNYYDAPAHQQELDAYAARNPQTGGVILRPNHVMMFFVLYFCMTGLHALHMIVGLGIVGTFIWLSSKNQFALGNDQPVEIAGLYWHFIDIIWVFLFPLLYLIAGFRPLHGG
jgi:cytochrome c oxidase subunit III